MPTKTVIYEANAQAFRALVRPSMFGRLGELEPAMADEMAVALQVWLANVINTTMAVTKLNDKGGQILGSLLSSARVYGASSMLSLRGQIFAYPYIWAHEFGAEIHPVNGQYLAIPIYDALRPDGSPKYRNPSSWQRWGSFVWTQRGSGKKFLVYKNAGGSLVFLYILVEKVTIPKRLGLIDMADTLYPALIEAWTIIYTEMAARSGILNVFGVEP